MSELLHTFGERGRAEGEGQEKGTMSHRQAQRL